MYKGIFATSLVTQKKQTAVIQHLCYTQHVQQKGNETERETSFGSIYLTAETYLPTSGRNSYTSLTNTFHVRISYTRYSTETQSHLQLHGQHGENNQEPQRESNIHGSTQVTQMQLS